MRIGSLQFTPTLWPTLAFIVVFPALLALGFWQLDRAEQKRDIFNAFASGAQEVVTLMGAKLPARYQRVKLQGRYISEHQFLLDNMIHDGHAGYYVLTPFVLNSGDWLLVNRGWLPLRGSRQTLPALVVGNEQRTIIGRVDNLPVPGIRLDKKTPTGGWPRVMQFPTIEQLEAQLDHGLLDGMILLNAKEPNGYVRSWQPQIMPPQRHLGYAVTWFGLAATLLVIYLVVNTNRYTKGL
ncbi:MAG TPA: SURF1 family protein [Gammaproteobacteria bacterium]|nr:SURF1 family protein [Gammaproteobacteria bacterium]